MDNSLNNYALVLMLALLEKNLLIICFELN